MIKRIELTVMDRHNKKVIRRFRVKANPVLKNGFSIKQHFTESGAEKVLEELIEQIDANNPGHHYRLVSLGRWRFKLVWDDERSESDEQSDTTSGAQGAGSVGVDQPPLNDTSVEG